MAKVKIIGALALTGLMGLGVIVPMNALAQARETNDVAAKSSMQKTIASTTDNSDGVMSYKDKNSGKSFVSEDNGESWVSEEEYNSSHPAVSYEWWTYDEYKVWLEQEKKNLQKMADEHTEVETSEGMVTWTQEMTDKYIAEYEKTLKEIQSGLLVSKSVDGDTESMTTLKSDWIKSTVD